jgi:hypothetical protein
MSIIDALQARYVGRILLPQTVQNIPDMGYMVYILTLDDKPIVLGHGQRNRAKVIFDDLNQITNGHIKALFVRAYRLFANGLFERFIIPCKDKNEAKQIESDLHGVIGGNSRDLPPSIMEAIFNNLQPGSVPHMVLQMAICSSFDGLSDLKMWRRKRILDDATWAVVGGRLQLPDSIE